MEFIEFDGVEGKVIGNTSSECGRGKFTTVSAVDDMEEEEEEEGEGEEREGADVEEEEAGRVSGGGSIERKVGVCVAEEVKEDIEEGRVNRLSVNIGQRGCGTGSSAFGELVKLDRSRENSKGEEEKGGALDGKDVSCRSLLERWVEVTKALCSYNSVFSF